MLAVLLLHTSGCDRTNPESFSELEISEFKDLKVSAFRPTAVSQVTIRHQFFGKLKPFQSQILVFQQSGVVIAAPEIGQKFLQGELIANLDLTELNAAKERIELQIPQAPAGGNTQSLQRQLADINKQIADRQIVANFDCIVANTSIQERGQVRQGSPAIEIYSRGNPRVVVSVPGKLARRIPLKTRLGFELDEKKYQCEVNLKAVTENSVGSLELDCKVTTPLLEGSWSFNQSVEMELFELRKVSGLAVPKSSLTKNAKGNWQVLSIDVKADEAIIKNVEVELLHADGEWCVIGTDLKNKPIVANGLHRVVNGQVVEVNDASESFEIPSDWKVRS